MVDIQRHIGMCARHHAKWKRMMDFAKTREDREKYLERSLFWLKMQSALVSLWAMEQNAGDNESKRKLVEAKTNLFVKLASYGRTIAEDPGL